jgi:hypothetical protein
MFSVVESCLVAHREFITVMFTLALILTGLASTVIAARSVRELSKQRVFQEWVCLRGVVHTTELALSELRSRALAAESDQQGLLLDETVAGLSLTIDHAQRRIAEIEVELGMHGQGVRK